MFAGASVLLADVSMESVMFFLQEGAGLLISGSVLGLGAGIAAGVTTSYSQQQLADVSPLRSYRSDIRAGLMSAFVAAIVVWAAVMLEPARFYGLYDGLDVEHKIMWTLQEIAYGLPPALGAFLWFSVRRCASWPYGIATALLAHAGTLPRRPLEFLSDAHRRGVLRQAGMTYEFRHVRLAERLRSP
jgi:hypothetical protein